MTKDIERERKAFEERFQHLDLDFVDDLGYCESETQIAWASWCAAKAHEAENLKGCVVVPESEYTELKGDKEHFSNACIDWTDRAYKQRAKVEHIKNEVERFKQSGTHLDLSNFLDNLIEFATFKHDDELKDFVLIKLNEKCIYAIEQEVEQQVEASGITTDVFRLDGEKILNAMLEAARGGNE